MPSSRYVVEFWPSAAREFRKLPPLIRQRVLDRLEDVALDPIGHPATRPLRGRPGRRLRVGDYRVLYRVEQKLLIVTVVKVARRSEAYDR